MHTLRLIATRKHAGVAWHIHSTAHPGKAFSVDSFEAGIAKMLDLGDGTPPELVVASTNSNKFRAECCKCHAVEWLDEPVLGVYFCSYGCT